ncbi:hypothetical protein RB653_002154, partial [Dictyostelium firmibasis]
NKFLVKILFLTLILFSKSVYSYRYNQCYVDCVTSRGCSLNDVKPSQICSIAIHECRLSCDN